MSDQSLVTYVKEPTVQLIYSKNIMLVFSCLNLFGFVQLLKHIINNNFLSTKHGP
jgi:hypothetical protein